MIKGSDANYLDGPRKRFSAYARSNPQSPVQPPSSISAILLKFLKKSLADNDKGKCVLYRSAQFVVIVQALTLKGGEVALDWALFFDPAC